MAATPTPHSLTKSTLGLACAMFLVGCVDLPQYAADEVNLAEQQIVPDHRVQLAGVMVELFGDADHPRLPSELNKLIDEQHVRQASGPVISHTPGVTQGLYRRHCARCHGVHGDGAGPAALYQYPYPRDFRAGVFKYKATERGAPPTDDDLHKVLQAGVPGTAMPSFELVDARERSALVDYVKFLAVRSEVERELVAYIADELDFDPDSGKIEPGSELSLEDEQTQAVVHEILAEVAARWLEAEARFVAATVPSDLDSSDRVEPGRLLFHDTQRTNCAKCHGEGGSGGVALKEYDDWNKRRQSFIETTLATEAAIATKRDRTLAADAIARENLRAELAADERRLAQRQAIADSLLPPRVAQPRQLTGGRLRGGDTPETIFRRLHEGIAGSPMPGVGSALTDEEIWNLVAYVRSLVYRSEATADAVATANEMTTN